MVIVFFLDAIYALNVLRCKIGIVVTILALFVKPISSQTNKDLKNLIDNIFASYTPKYMINQQHALTLDVSFYLSSITEVNEVKKKLVTTGYLELSWTDELLSWTPSDYNSTETILFPIFLPIKYNFEGLSKSSKMR